MPYMGGDHAESSNRPSKPSPAAMNGAPFALGSAGDTNSHPLSEPTSSRAVNDVSKEPVKVNGISSPLSNGFTHSKDLLETTRGSVGAVVAQNKINGSVHDRFTWPSNEPPPELEKIPYEIEPLGVLFNRVAQDCFNALRRHIELLADPPRSEVLNPSDLALVSLWKKRRWLAFAQEQRARFLKLFVLLKWSNRAADVSQLVDVRFWIGQQLEHYQNVEIYLRSLKFDMQGETIPGPDIDAALEVLTTSKSSRLPSLGYIPPEPISAAKLLSTIRNLNHLLHVRLHLHEDLPPHFRNFTISSGRATFVVPAEFEVDLSVADEDPASPIFFIDFRFLFYPRSEIPTGVLRDRLELNANHALASGGLAACFDLLHDFTLTHKINVLRRQAIDLNLSSFAGQLRIDQVHRFITIQYWRTRSRSKSWLEIGVASGKVPKGKSSLAGPQPSKLSIRWFRNGKEVVDAAIRFDHVRLNIQTAINDVLAKHIAHTFESLHRNYNALPNSNGATTTRHLQLKLSEKDPSESCLRLPLRTKCTGSIVIEPISGNFVLQPPSALSSRYEQRMNSPANTLDDISSIIHQWQASELQHELEGYAAKSSVDFFQDIRLDSATVRRCFGSGTLRLSFFKGRRWRSTWCFVASIGSSGEKWWVADIRFSSEGGYALVSHEALLLDHDILRHRQISPDAFVGAIEGLAVWKISVITFTRQLTIADCPHQLQDRVASHGSSSKPMLTINVQKLMARDKPEDAIPPNTSIWGWNHVVIAFTGLEDDDQANSRLVARGKLREGPAIDLLGSIQNPQVSVASDGVFAVTATGPLGDISIFTELKARLKSLERLLSVLGAISARKLACQVNSLDDIAFEYSGPGMSKAEPLKASLSFGVSGDDTAIDLSPSRNPHNRLVPYFNNLVRSDPSGVGNLLSEFLKILDVTLPVLRAFDDFESADASASDLVIHVHQFTTYRLSIPHQNITFEMRSCTKNDGEYWIARTLPESGNPNKEFKQKMMTFFKQRGIEGFTPLGTGFATTLATAHDATLRFCKMIRESISLLPAPSGSDSAGLKKPIDSKQLAAMNDTKDSKIKNGQLGQPGTSMPRGKPTLAHSQPLMKQSSSQGKPGNQGKAASKTAQAPSAIKKEDVIEID